MSVKIQFIVDDSCDIEVLEISGPQKIESQALMVWERANSSTVFR